MWKKKTSKQSCYAAAQLLYNTPVYMNYFSNENLAKNSQLCKTQTTHQTTILVIFVVLDVIDGGDNKKTYWLLSMCQTLC